MYNTLKRSILSKGTTFNYSYIKGKEFITEFNPTTLRDYNISNISVCEWRCVNILYSQTVYCSSQLTRLLLNLSFKII